MLHFVSKNPSTLDVKPLSHYKRTFRQIERKAMARQGGCFSTLESTKRVAQGLPDDELDEHNVLIFRQANFTIACLTFNGEPVGFGYAKRNPLDVDDDPAKSENISIHRAISNCFVDEIRDMARPADSFVYRMELVRAQPEDGEPMEVNRVKPVLVVLDEAGNVDPTAFLPAASPFSNAPLHPDEFGGSDYPTEPHAVS